MGKCEESPKEWSSEDYLKLRHVKEALERPESVLDVALGSTEAYREALQVEMTASHNHAARAAGLETALWDILDAMDGNDFAVVRRMVRRALGLSLDDEKGTGDIE